MRERDSASHEFRPDVEGIRGVAVLVVVLFHAGLGGVIGGFVGVDVFFVISGFLITGLLVREREQTGRVRLTQFYARRARRLLPAAIVVLIATLVAALSLMPPLDRPGVGLDAAAAAVSVGNIRFALAAGDYFTTVTTPSPFLHFWSLAVEEQFYLVWPALIVLVAGRRYVRVRVALALVAVVGASFAANILLTETAPNWAFYSLPTRAWQLGLGGLLAVAGGALARAPGPLVGLVGWAGLAAVVIATLTLDPTMAYPGVAALLPTLGAVGLIAGGSRALGPGRLLSLRPLRYLGRISYSLYLVHWPILVLAPMAIGGEPDELARVGLVGASVLAAVVSWALIETPFRTGLPRLATRPRLTLSFGVAAMLAVVVIAAVPSFGATPSTTVAAADTDSLLPTEEVWIDEVVAPGPSSTPTLPLPTVAPATASPARPATPPPAVPSAGGPVASLPVALPEPSAEARLPASAAPSPNLATPTPTLDVRPALADARADEERLRKDHCLAFEPIVEPAKCVYGDPTAAFTVALVGDSHAAQWFPALDRVARHEHWRVLTFVKVACPFIDMRVTNLMLKREYRECAAFNEATLLRLTAEAPDLTLVSMSRIAIHPLVDSADTVAAKGAAIGRMIGRIPGRTAIIVDTPYAKRDVPACLSAHQDDPDECAIPRATAFTDRLGDIEAVAAKGSGASLIDLTPRICPSESACPVVVDGMIVYRDEAHLTATFSKSLAPALAASLKAVLSAP